VNDAVLPEDAANRPPKLPYHRPDVTDYGDVEQLTASGSGGSSDGGMLMSP
jgi:hypothetical protein